MPLEPILLLDHDGLRTIKSGSIGRYPFVTQHNPALIAQAVSERCRRELIREDNFKHWS